MNQIAIPEDKRRTAPMPFQVLAKPSGPQCNLDCDYCFYTYKTENYGARKRLKLTPKLLESYIRQYIESHNGRDDICFLWQGGEPTLLGVEYFEQAVSLQQRYCPPGKKISNHFQTNGVLINDCWAAFFAKHDFLIGLSLDGPQPLHDLYRKTLSRKGSFNKVMAGLERLKKYGVKFNTLTVVGRHNYRYAKEIYSFLKLIGSEHMQFIPLVERQTSSGIDNKQTVLAGPPSHHFDPLEKLTNWSVPPSGYGQFMNEVFDLWVRSDIGKVYVQLFDVQLGTWLGQPASLCIFAPTCGQGPVLEHNGDVYACDHFVYDDYLLGNIRDTSLIELVNSNQQHKFGQAKRTGLPRQCKTCSYLAACNGGCPKQRFLKTRKESEFGLNYLCKSYRLFFEHTDPYFQVMAELILSGRPAADIMELTLKQHQYGTNKIGRNDPCPCGSKRKFKRCCAEN